MADWLKYLKDFGSAIVEGSTYDPEGTIGRYMAGLEPIDGESPITASKESRLNKKEFADRNWMLGYAPFAAAAGAAALPYLAPSTVGGTAMGRMAGLVAIGDISNKLLESTTGKTFGGHVRNAIGYEGGDGFWGELYRASTEALNPFYGVDPKQFLTHSAAFVKALPLLFAPAKSNRLYSTIFGPTPELFENFEKAFTDGIIEHPEWIKGTTLLNDKLLARLAEMIKYDSYDNNVPALNAILKKLAEAFYKLKRKTLVKRGKQTPELKLLLQKFDEEAAASLARFNDPKFYISPYNIEEAAITEAVPKAVVPEVVALKAPITLEDITLLFLTHTNPRLALTDAIESSNTKITDNGIINDIKLGLRNGDFIAKKGRRLADNETLGGYDWNYGQDYSDFLYDLGLNTNLRGFHLFGDNSNYVTRFGIESNLGVGHASGKFPLAYGDNMTTSNIFELGNKHIANRRFRTVLGSKSYMKYIEDLKLKFLPAFEDKVLTRAVELGTNNSTYTFAKELQASLYNYLRHSLGRLVTVPEWQLFIRSISLNKKFLNDLIKNQHGGRYELIDTGATPEDYIKLFSLYKQGGQIKKRF